jgi:hypothetical protein
LIGFVVPDVGDLMRVAVPQNPFIPCAAVIERTVVSEHIGLLVGDAPEGMTLVYLWAHEDPECLTWLIHLARWRESYPAWRSAHGLPSCARPLRVIVAVPGGLSGLRDAVRVLVGSVAVARYQCLDLDGTMVLGWETDKTSGYEEQGDRIAEREPEPARDVVRSRTSEILTPDEWAFFQPLKNR